MSRGDVVRLPPARRSRGREQRGARYGVVVQSDALHPLSTVIVVPTSRSALPTSFRPTIRIGRELTRVLPEQIRSADLMSLREPVARVSPEEMETIDDALRELLSLPGQRSTPGTESV